MTAPQPTVRVSGPLFDGRALAAADQFIDAAEAEIAEEGVNDVRAELGAVLRNPTGFYESQIQTQRARGDAVVTDGGVIYGPWLESGAYTPRRNFSGYGTFRRTTQRLDAKAEQIAQSVLPPFLRRMN